MSYRSSILEELAPLGRASDVDPRHVEGYMRLEHPTLDGLSREQFRLEVWLCVGVIDEGGKDNAEQNARSFGL